MFAHIFAALVAQSGETGAIAIASTHIKVHRVTTEKRNFAITNKSTNYAIVSSGSFVASKTFGASPQDMTATLIPLWQPPSPLQSSLSGFLIYESRPYMFSVLEGFTEPSS